ncbi:MAG: SOS response-associated peptidase [Chloroflexi bacterium]|jgi:putative SOS response-associated peptidase YedK|nr:SOS response-associated peptidase [Chloroflexota bacterium]
MCGRFILTVEAPYLQQEFRLGDLPLDWQSRYNIAPSQPVAVVRDAQARNVEWMRWGLVPFWANDVKIGNRMINARAETLQEKPAFRTAFQKRRCLILADGFYEWQKPANKRGRSTPYLIRLRDHKPFAFAGLWEFWKSKEGEELLSCTIITTQANSLVEKIHDRMPVMLSGDRLWEWLQMNEAGELNNLLRPYPADQMEAVEVSPLVNNPVADSPEVARPLERLI